MINIGINEIHPGPWKGPYISLVPIFGVGYVASDGVTGTQSRRLRELKLQELSRKECRPPGASTSERETE